MVEKYWQVLTCGQSKGATVDRQAHRRLHIRIAKALDRRRDLSKAKVGGIERCNACKLFTCTVKVAKLRPNRFVFLRP